MSNPCSHIVGLHESPYHDGGAFLVEYDGYINHRHLLSKRERFSFCPTCGARINYAPAEAAWAARDKQDERDAQLAREQKRLMRWPT